MSALCYLHKIATHKVSVVADGSMSDIMNGPESIGGENVERN